MPLEEHVPLQTEATGFFSLPHEVRCMIYEHAFLPHTVSVRRDPQPTFAPAKRTEEPPAKWLMRDPKLPSVNRLFYEEAMPYLFPRRSFAFDNGRDMLEWLMSIDQNRRSKMMGVVIPYTDHHPAHAGRYRDETNLRSVMQVLRHHCPALERVGITVYDYDYAIRERPGKKRYIHPAQGLRGVRAVDITRYSSTDGTHSHDSEICSAHWEEVRLAMLGEYTDHERHGASNCRICAR